ncbi:phosphotransferase [bacterium]|nr:phosphotransferase [candidate division CSSED10-310 bacterium]
MERRIRERFSEDILDEAMMRFGIGAECIHLLDGFESYIYEYQKNSRSFVLRIGHSIRRNAEMVMSEIDWINYLSIRGAAVAAAVKSSQDRYVELIPDGRDGSFVVVSFVKAPGKPPRKEIWQPEFFETYGKTIGRMHRLTQRYQPSEGIARRPDWNHPDMLEIERFVPANETEVLNRYRELMAYLESLSVSEDSYGLIHQDAHGGNLFVDDTGGITLFDFDDCVYSWLINDIAIVLFYAALPARNPVMFTRIFMTHFLKGYRTENTLSPEWLKEIPHFLKLREIDMYAIIHRSFDVENLEDPWCRGYMKDRRKKIESGVPFMDFDFEELSDSLL